MSTARSFNTIPSALVESEFRMMGRTIYDTKIAGGWARSSDTGQINWDAPLVTGLNATGFAAVLSNLSTNVPERVIDGSTANVWSSGLTPSSGAPVYLIHDAGKTSLGGSAVTNTCLSYRIYFQNTTADPTAWTLCGTNTLDFSKFGATVWTTIDTQTAQSAGGSAGYKPYTGFSNSTAYRYYALIFTGSNGAALQIAEWNMYTAAGLGGTMFMTGIVTYRPTSTSSSTGASTGSVNYEMWNMGDSIQTTGTPCPAFEKLEYGTGATFGNPSIWATTGTGSDGAGNLTGANVQTRTQVYNPGAFTPTLYRGYASADTDRFCISLHLNGGSTYAWQYGIERLGDPTTGADTNEGIGVVWFTTSARNYYPVNNTSVFGGAAPSLETDSPGVMSTVATSGVYGNYQNFEDVGLRLGPRKYGPSRNWCNYYKDVPAEQTFTPTFLGGTKTFLALGNSVQPYARGGYSGGAAAMRYE